MSKKLLLSFGGMLALAIALVVAFGGPGRGPLSAAESDQTTFVDLKANDIIYDPVSDMMYASVPSTVPDYGNSIVAVDPHTGALGPSVFVGSEPGKMAVSDDGQYLYVSLGGAAAVRRVVVQPLTADIQFGLGSDPITGSFYVEDIEVLPGDAHAVAVSRRNAGFSPRHEGVAVYDDGVQRATTTPDHTGSNAIEFSDSASMLYGYNNETSEFGFRRMTVDASGVSVDNVTNNLISNYNVDIEYDGGLVYATSGRVIEPEVLTILGTFAASGPVAPDSSVNRTFFLSGSTITAFNQTTFTSAGTLQVIGVSSGSGLIRWGDRGLALRTSTQIVIIETSLVAPKLTGTPTSTPPSGPTPSPTTEPPATPTAPQPTATPAGQTGDASCDGNVNSIDASLLLQVTAALVAALPCPEGADVNEDGVANALDAALILQFDAGLIDALPPA